MAKSLDLDALRRPPLKVNLDGAEHALTTPTLDAIGKFSDLSKAADAGDASVIREMVALIAPSIDAGALDSDQARALFEFWTATATEETKKDEQDAKDVLKDPTRPG